MNRHVNTVVITRPKEDARQLAALLKEKGVRAIIEPMLRIVRAAKADAKLRAALKEKPQAVLVTSRHAVAALAKHPRLRRLKLFAVGKATAECAREAGFKRTVVAGETVKEMIAYVKRRIDARKGPLLYARGADVRADMRAALKGFRVRSVIAYKARIAGRLSPRFAAALKAGHIKAVLFFSERSAANYVRLVERRRLGKSHARARAVCMSRVIAASARKLPWGKVQVCATPDLKGMIDKVLSL